MKNEQEKWVELVKELLQKDGIDFEDSKSNLANQPNNIDNMKTKFQGIKKKMYPVEIAGFYVIQDGKDYGDNNVLDFDDDESEVSEEVRKEIAFANAQLFCTAPKMLEAMQLFCDRVDKGEVRSIKTYNQFKELIKEATTL